MLRVAINGFGRIGRGVLRSSLARGQPDQGPLLPIEIVAINDLHDAAGAAHLFKYDSNHGRLDQKIHGDEAALTIDGRQLHWCREADPENLPWARLGIDLVLECTGQFVTAQAAAGHLQAGARKVLISAPATGVDRTVVFGVNDQMLDGTEQILSNASCTTNCLALIADQLLQPLGIEQGMVTTIHCATNDQVVQDGFHRDRRRGRAMGQSIIPTTTGVVQAVSEVLPQLAGKLQGFSLRVPTQNVSLLDFTFTAGRITSKDEVNQLFRQAAQGHLAGLLEVSEEPLVSVDFNRRSASAVVDATLTRVSGNLVKVCAWYDNEWGFANRMLDVAASAFSADGGKV